MFVHLFDRKSEPKRWIKKLELEKKLQETLSDKEACHIPAQIIHHHNNKQTHTHTLAHTHTTHARNTSNHKTRQVYTSQDKTQDMT